MATKIEAVQTSNAQNMVRHLILNILFEASMGIYDYAATRQITPFSTYLSSLRFSINKHLPSPEYSVSPSTHSEYPTIVSEQSQNTIPQTEQPLTLHHRLHYNQNTLHSYQEFHILLHEQ